MEKTLQINHFVKIKHCKQAIAFRKEAKPSNYIIYVVLVSKNEKVNSTKLIIAWSIGFQTMESGIQNLFYDISVSFL